MFQLLQPIWLYAMAGIAIPIIIHLWDVRGGKKLKVGSILLIEESAKLQGRSLRLTDIVLLILRCLVILILAIVLCKPIMKKSLTVVEEKGWLMIAKEDIREAYKFDKPAIDSLIKSGYKFHYFNNGFAEEDFANALKKTDSTGSPDSINYWTLLRRLNEKVPQDLPIYLVTNNRLKGVAGQRPELSMALTLVNYASEDSVEMFPALAYKTADDSIRVFTAKSSNESVIFQHENVSPKGNDKYKINNNKLGLASQPVHLELDVDTAGIRVIIFPDQNNADANYLVAAIEAIQAYTDRDIEVAVVKTVADIKSKPDWLFWLSEKPLPVAASAKKIFYYATGKGQAIESWIRDLRTSEVGSKAIGLSRRIQIREDGKNYETIWADGYGNPLLIVSNKENNLFQFYARFNPAWTELPWSSRFVEMILHLLVPVKKIKPDVDKRVIAVSQFQPIISKTKKAFDKANFIQQKDLSKYFWLLAFLIFAAERFLSLKSKKAYA